MRRFPLTVGFFVALAAVGSIRWHVSAQTPGETASGVLSPWAYPGATRLTTFPSADSPAPPATRLFGAHYNSSEEAAQVWRFYQQKKTAATVGAWPSDSAHVNFYEQRADGSGQNSIFRVRRPDPGVGLLIIRRPQQTVTVQLVPAARPNRGTDIFVIVDRR